MKRNLLISTPSLDLSDNVSGISTVVSLIMKNRAYIYRPLVVGRRDNEPKLWSYYLSLLLKLLLLPYTFWSQKIALFHQNLPVDQKGIVREFWFHQVACLCRIPVVLHLHGGELLASGTGSKLLNAMLLRMFSRSAAILVLSNEEKQTLIKRFGNQLNILVFSNSVEMPTVQLDVALKKRPLQLLFMGRIHQSKGVHQIISALAALKHHCAFEFVLCGRGPELESVLQRCEDELSGFYIYKGVVSGSSKEALLKNAAIFLLPSSYEGLPMALLEAMSYGVVPVVTKVGAMSSLIQEHHSGLFVDIGSVDQLRESIQKLLSDPDSLQRYSVNAIEEIDKHYNLENYLKRLNRVYAEYTTNR